MTLASEDSTPMSLKVMLLGFQILLRTLVGLHHHSGQDNFHGAMGGKNHGDCEAQRHWMELTLHLPISEWYRYDLDYWGLDYPPISAYLSYLCGWGSHHLIGPETMALDTSRGYEDPTHKAYMRATVLLCDILVYFSAIWLACHHKGRYTNPLASFFFVLVQPAIILVDHGHFQYNTVSLGCAVFAFYHMTSPKFEGCLLGSLFFCLALNFKQMTLYYAPAVFFYLLGRCLSDPKRFAVRFCLLGSVVIATFFAIWCPFYFFDQSDTSIAEQTLHYLRRIFPFQRGLFESKVANLWCALSIRPFSLKDRVPQDLQPLAAFLATFCLMMPACLALLRLGIKRTRNTKTNPDEDWFGLLWGCTACSLAFFLASFQVHEKSILMALTPASLIYSTSKATNPWVVPSGIVEWFSLACVWSLWPLMELDRLEVAYFCLNSIFLASLWLFRRQRDRSPISETTSDASWTSKLQLGVWKIHCMIVLPGSCAAMLALHLLQMFRAYDESRYPDFIPVIWSLGGCLMFLWMWVLATLRICLPAPLKVKES